jgi:hypothetical protein
MKFNRDRSLAWQPTRTSRANRAVIRDVRRTSSVWIVGRTPIEKVTDESVTKLCGGPFLAGPPL